MFSDLECGICFQIYNAGRRCPRQLFCKHSFCESCLVILTSNKCANPNGTLMEPTIFCPLCRHCTCLSDGGVKDKLMVDEDIFERMLTAGVLDESVDDDDQAPQSETQVSSLRQPETHTVTVPPSSRGKLMRSLRRLCSKVTGDCHRDERGYTTSQELRDLAMMSSYMI